MGALVMRELAVLLRGTGEPRCTRTNGLWAQVGVTAPQERNRVGVEFNC